MLKNLKNQKDTTDAMLSLLPTSGTLAGISIGLVGVVNLKQLGSVSTIADEMLLLSSIGFLSVCYLIFFALRSVNPVAKLRWAAIIDVVFLVSLTLVVFSGFVIVFEFI